MIEQPQQKHPVTVTRQELYAQVWRTPMARLASEYGISGNGLAKICDRLNIPYPPRGYWAKKAAGKNVVAYRLPEAKKGTPEKVTITPTPPPIVPPEPTEEVRQQIEKVQAAVAPLEVPERLLRPHPVIAEWLADHERRKQEARKERDPWRKRLLDPGEFSTSDRRMHRILDTLFKALERQGAKIKQGDRRELSAEVQGERVEFQLRQKQVRRPLTDEEKRWRSSDDKGWRQELQPTGKLVFTIKTYLPAGLRTGWLESDSAPMESLLADIAAVFMAAGPLLVDRRRQREEEERQRRLAEQKRYEEEQRRKRDDNRWRRFVDIAHQWQDAKLARDFLDALKQMAMDQGQMAGDRSLDEWIAWAEERLKAADPLNHGAGAIFNSVSSVNEWNYRG